MGKLGKMLDTFCFSSASNSCFCVKSMEFDEEFEGKPLIASDSDRKLRLKDVVAGKQTLAFQLKPKIVILRVSMHCHGCARKVEKHVSKLEEWLWKTKDEQSYMHGSFELYVLQDESSEVVQPSTKGGVSSYKIDLETKMVVVIGDILPLEVLESVSKVKNAQIWDSPR